MTRFNSGYAVLVGVGADLPVTVEDAAAVADLLRDPERCAYPEEQVKLLTGSGAERSCVLEGLDWLAEQSKKDPAATAVVYYSGHGAELPEYYLLPNGYDVTDKDTMIAGELFTEKLKAIESQKLIVLLDCCHAGGQADIKAKGLDGVQKSPLPPSVIEELGRSSGRVIIASSRQDELSYTGQPYSVFTQALMEGLAGYNAFEPDGYARVVDLMLHVGRMVPERTQDKQHPIVKIADLADNFALAYYAGGDTKPKSLPWSYQAPQPPVAATMESQSLRRRLGNRREALLLIEERMSEFVEYHEIPLQYVKNRRRTEEDIARLEAQLGMLGQ